MLVPANLDPVQVYLDGLPSPASVRTMRSSLIQIALLLTDQPDPKKIAWGQLTYGHSMALRTALKAKYSTSSTNKILSAYRNVLRTAWRLGMLESEMYQKAVDVSDIAHRDTTPGRFLEKDELQRLFAVCAADETVAGARDLALLHIMAYGGLRRGEISALNVEDFDADDRSVKINQGKGRLTRQVFLPNKTVAVILGWLSVYQPASPSAPLFVPVTRNAKGFLAQRLADNGMYTIVRERCKEAGLQDVKPHDFRRTYISNLIDKGVDLSTVGKLAGHNNLDTTLSYDRRKDDPKRRAADLLDED